MKINEVQIFPKARRHPAAQRQDSLNDQLRDLIRMAVKHGMYDAADYLERHVMNKTALSKGGGTYHTVKKDGDFRRVYVPGSETQLSDNGPKNS